jgi:hypothetical protein
VPISPILLPQDQLVRACTVVRGEYDFAVDGGVAGTIALTAGLPIPLGAVVVGGYIDVLTQVTGPGASIAAQIEAANDVLTAVAIASWTVGRKNILPALTTGALTACTAVKTTAARDISIVISGANLTAGKFDVVVYVIPPLA